MDVVFEEKVWKLHEIRAEYFDILKKNNPYCLVNIFRYGKKETEIKMVLLTHLIEFKPK